MASQPNFYIVRPGTISHWSAAGELVHEPNIVPLIPADLLPDYIDLEGVSRHLRFTQTVGMTNLGSMAAPENQYRVRFILPQSEDDNENAGTPSGSLAASVTPKSALGGSEPGHDKSDERLDNEEKKVLERLQDTRRTPETGSPNGLASSRHNVNSQAPTPTNEEPPPARGLSETDNSTPPTPPNESKPPQKKAYCSFWVRNGWCHYNRNCRYRHQMPTTAEGLRSVGLQGWPKWMLEYMHTERLPAPPSQDKKLGLRKSRSQCGLGNIAGDGIGSMMSAEAARGRKEDEDRRMLANKKAWKKGAKKGSRTGTLIDLL